MEKNPPAGRAGKTGKYLKYAIGEILLVMVGILLALQVNNWNSERKDRISERKLLDNIHRDFIANKVNFDSLKVETFRSKAALDSMISLFPYDRDTVKQKAYREQRRLVRGIIYNAYSSSVESVINSNALQLIQDEELQKYLVSWKDVLLDYKEEETNYFNFLNDHYWLYTSDVLDYTGSDKEMNLAARSSVKFQNMIIMRRNYLNGVINAIKNEPIEHHINEIIRLTEPKDK